MQIETQSARQRRRAIEKQADTLTYLAAERYADQLKGERRSFPPGQFAAYVCKALPLVGLDRFVAAFSLYARETFGVDEAELAAVSQLVSSASSCQR